MTQLELYRKVLVPNATFGALIEGAVEPAHKLLHDIFCYYRAFAEAHNPFLHRLEQITIGYSAASSLP